MRYLLLIAVVGAALATVNANERAPLDVPVAGQFRVIDTGLRDLCGLWTTIEQVARHGRVRVGFQDRPECWLAPSTRDPGQNALNLDGRTPRAALDYVIGWRPDFRWREIDGVVVVRPVVVWEDPSDALNRPVAPFLVANVHAHQALHTVLESAQPTLFQPHNDLKLSGLGRRRFDPLATGLIDVPISVKFPGGTLLQALNAVTKPFGGIWRISGSLAHVELRTLAFAEGSTGAPVFFRGNGPR